MSQDRATDTNLTWLYQWLTERPRPARIRALAVAVTAAMAAVVAAAIVDLGEYAALVGSPAGIVVFAAALAWRATVATPQQVAATDLKARVPQQRRRFLVIVATALWVILVLLVGRHVPDVVAGSLTVVVAACLVTAFRSGPDDTSHQS